MKRILLPALLLVLFATVMNARTATLPAGFRISPAGDTSWRIIPAAGNTYGYEILINSKLLIRQANIPGVPGNKGFTQKSAAEKVARLVVKKLQKGQMPPTVTSIELDSLNIKIINQ